jgi:hypothetical protein
MHHACRVCGTALEPRLTVPVRGRPAELLRCPACELHEFAEPVWLEEANRDPVAQIDVGLANRCQAVANLVETIVRAQGLQQRRLLDYGGGYGLLTRLVRNAGLDMAHHDPMAANLFAQGFEGEPADDYGLCTLIEVLEHLTDPRSVLEQLRHVDLLLLTTQLVPAGSTDLSGWPYLVKDLGQHITFYSRDALARLGADFGYRLTSDGVGVHLLHRANLSPITRTALRRHRVASVTGRALRRMQHGKSLQDRDALTVRASFSSD